MLSFVLRWLITAVSVFAAAHIVNGVHYDSYTALIITALMLGVINAFLRPLLLLVTLPLNILSFGILTLFINAFLFWLVGKMVNGFVVTGFWAAFWGALIVSIVSFFLNSFLFKKGRIQFYRSHSNPSSTPNHDVIDV